MTSTPPHEIRLVRSDFVEDRWDEISELLTVAFSGAAFSASFPPGRPAQHTREEMRKPGGGELGHVVAVDGDGRVLGAIFCLQTERPADETTCDVGWFFTDPALPASERTKLANALVNRVHDELRKSGYEAVVTEMGTEAGALYLSRRHGYVPAPLGGGKKNRWIKGLRTAAGGGISSNSATKSWKNEREQLARYATADIAKDEVIIDLKILLKRARRSSVDTLQLGEGLHYRSSAESPCLNHHCSPNGYIGFDDLTYRALRDVSAGEELTFNYCTTEFEMDQPFGCVCGSVDCLGWVGGFRFLKEPEIERIFNLLSPYLKSTL